MITIPNEVPAKYKNLPYGLRGYWWETNNVICIPLVWAGSKEGTFSSFLKMIDKRHKLLFFPSIVSARLGAILRAKGYQDAMVYDDEMGAVSGLARDDRPNQQ